MLTATKSSKIDITLERDTKSISKKLSSFLTIGDIIFLKGELGVGKTTFVKYLINNLQLKSKEKTTEIPSPTFNIVYEYKVGKMLINHYDLYRIKNQSDLKNIGILEDYKDKLTFIEWPEILEDNIKNKIVLSFNYEDNLKKRSLVISSKNRIDVVNEFR